MVPPSDGAEKVKELLSVFVMLSIVYVDWFGPPFG